jgi:hypothetical protein
MIKANKDYSNKLIKTELEDAGFIVVIMRGSLKGYKLLDNLRARLTGV